VFVGPHVCFTNDRYPMSPKEMWEKTHVYNGASIGAGVVVVPGLTIGAGVIVGAGSVIICDIPDFEIWAGNPAKKLRNV